MGDSGRERCKIREVRFDMAAIRLKSPKIFEYGSLVRGALKVVLT
jgi:hypothetical protein